MSALALPHFIRAALHVPDDIVGLLPVLRIPRLRRAAAPRPSMQSVLAAGMASQTPRTAQAKRLAASGRPGGKNTEHAIDLIVQKHLAEHASRDNLRETEMTVAYILMAALLIPALGLAVVIARLMLLEWSL